MRKSWILNLKDITKLMSFLLLLKNNFFVPKTNLRNFFFIFPLILYISVTVNPIIIVRSADSAERTKTIKLLTSVYLELVERFEE